MADGVPRAVRGDVRHAVVPRGAMRWPTTCCGCSATRRTAGSSRSARTRSEAGRPAEGPVRQRRSIGELGGGDGAAAAGAVHRRRRLRGCRRCRRSGSWLDGMRRAPSGFGHALCALDFAVGPVKEVAIVGDPEAEDTLAMIRVVRERYRPNVVVAVAAPDDAEAAEAIPLLRDRPQVDGKAPPTSASDSPASCRSPPPKTSAGNSRASSLPEPTLDLEADGLHHPARARGHDDQLMLVAGHGRRRCGGRRRAGRPRRPPDLRFRSCLGRRLRLRPRLRARAGLGRDFRAETADLPDVPRQDVRHPGARIGDHDQDRLRGLRAGGVPRPGDCDRAPRRHLRRGRARWWQLLDAGQR